MRETAKSMLRFSWALSVFGLEQVAKLLRESDSGHRGERIREAFDTLSAATGEQLGGRTRNLYDAGDKLQAESVDLLFDMVRPGNWNPDKVMDRAADFAERSAEALRDVAHSKDDGEDAPKDAPKDAAAKEAASKKDAGKSGGGH